jgi:hypothetical protein
MIVQPPTPEILAAVDLFDQFVDEVIRANQSPGPDSGLYEAPYEARLLLIQAIRHTEAVITLARHDLVLAPAARTITRATFEICQRVRWLLLPEDPFAREARWVAHLADEEKLWERLASIAQTTGEPVADYSAIAQHIFAFRTGVAAKLPKGVPPPKKVTNLREMLREDGKERHYISYTLLSQSAHGTHFGSATYRRGLGTQKEFSEPQFATEWRLHLRICFWSLHRAISRIIEVSGEPGVQAGSPETVAALNDALAPVGGGWTGTPPPTG